MSTSVRLELWQKNTYYISLSQDSNQEAVSTGLDKKLEKKYSVAKKGKDVSIIKMHLFLVGGICLTLVKVS